MGFCRTKQKMRFVLIRRLTLTIGNPALLIEVWNYPVGPGGLLITAFEDSLTFSPKGSRVSLADQNSFRKLA